MINVYAPSACSQGQDPHRLFNKGPGTQHTAGKQGHPRVFYKGKKKKTWVIGGMVDRVVDGWVKDGWVSGVPNLDLLLSERCWRGA